MKKSKVLLKNIRMLELTIPKVFGAETFFAGVLWSELFPDTLKKFGFISWLIDIKPPIALPGHKHYAFEMFEKGSLRICHGWPKSQQLIQAYAGPSSVLFSTNEAGF